MRLGLMGRKLGMTQIFNENKDIIPVTVVEATPNVVVQQKTEEIDGYFAIKLGFEDQKPGRVSRPDAGQFKIAGCGTKKFLQEVRFDETPGDDFAVGKEVSVSVFNEGDKVDVAGTSKGRGFSGVIRRHNFKTALEGHGTHEFFRHGGAIGMNMTPGHVAKGMKMPGQFGNHKVTTQNLVVVKIDQERNLLYIKGAVPGAKQGLVFVSQAVKA